MLPDFVGETPQAPVMLRYYLEWTEIVAVLEVLYTVVVVVLLVKHRSLT